MSLQHVNQLTQLYGLVEETKPAKNSEISSEKHELLYQTLSKLINWGLVSDPNQLRTWANDLADLSEIEIINGLRRAKDWSGEYMTLPKFRNLCKEGKLHVSHRPYLALPGAPAMDSKKLQTKLRALKETI